MQQLAYLVSEYPGISHTFILREIFAMRACGLTVATASIRRPQHLDRMPEPERREAENTLYIKATPIKEIITIHWRLLSSRPMAYLGMIAATVRAYRRGARDALKAVGYLAEAGILIDWMHARELKHVHVHFANPAATVAMLATAYGTVSYSLSIHGPDEFYNVDKNLLTDKVSSARFVRCISHYCRSQVMRLVSPKLWENFHIVRCGIDPEVFQPRAEPQNTLTELLCLGRLVPAKGQHILLQACAELQRRGVPFHLTLVGDGEDRQSLEALTASFALGDAVTFTGAVGGHQVHAYYDRADIFVLASFAEGVPVVLMEAMAKGVACVSTGITGIPELIDDERDGMLVPPSDETALADRLQRLIEKPEQRIRFGLAGRDKVLERYDLARNCRGLARIFNALEP